MIQDATKTLEVFKAVFSEFKTEQINIVPFQGSWTAGQLAEHIILSNAGFNEVINGPVGETNRPADQQVERIRTDLLNFNNKMDSPPFIYPAKTDYFKNEQLDKLGQIEDGILKSIDNLDLTKTCKSFELPVLGYLTRLEAVYFVIYHTQRHTQQLKNIYNELSSN